MATGKVKTENGKLVIEFDQSAQGVFDGMQSVSAYKARNGLVIIESAQPASVGNSGEHKQEGMLPPEQGRVLQKLISLRFEERTPSNVQGLLTQEEGEVLDSMLESGLIRLYKGGKYAKTGVISIPDSIFPKIPKEGHAQTPAQAGNSNASGPARQYQAGQAPRQDSGIPIMQKIEKFGYTVLQNDAEAKEASNSLSAQIKEGKIKGVRAFDRRYYIASKEFYEFHRPAFLDKLEKSAYTPEAIAKALSVDTEAAMVMLALMSSEGEALEKRKGTYSHA
ncbi:MAG: hypothetical protein WC506_04060 [Candidatus Micrarchaeia archaeon]